ncbi:MAG TPA: uracil-DNA glycosylase [Sulfitobacter sp.]|nr:uracil-DNA glycosylase [Roseovarius sp.]HCQ59582.1 uracil-DNA glycosylase [Sulfitobacter sp.]|tara:strand:- start:160 stop:777 length:618 start_codon:yes stop_codon:yes gene_type:complete
MVAETAELSTPAARAARLAALDAPHMHRLNAYCRGLRDLSQDVPWFDPFDGGEHASVLILLERPARRGEHPRFVSRDNPSPTQRNLKRSLEQAGLKRSATLIWNVVPWLPSPGTKRNRQPSAGELEEGFDRLAPLLQILKNLRLVVLAGRSASRARIVVSRAGPDLIVLEMPHPSPVHVNTDPTIRERLDACLRQAASFAQLSRR